MWCSYCVMVLLVGLLSLSGWGVFFVNNIVRRQNIKGASNNTNLRAANQQIRQHHPPKRRHSERKIATKPGPLQPKPTTQGT